MRREKKTTSFTNNKSTHLIVRPIADDLQAVRQVAVGVREVRLELQGGPVRLDRLRDVAGVLVDAGEVAVGVGKRRVYVYGARVALQRA